MNYNPCSCPKDLSRFVLIVCIILISVLPNSDSANIISSEYKINRNNISFYTPENEVKGLQEFRVNYIKLDRSSRHYTNPVIVYIPETVKIASGILLAQTTALVSFGQPLFYPGRIRIWTGDIMGAENSQQLTDPYTFTHVIHGFVLYWTLNNGIIPIPLEIQDKYLIALAFEALWEIVENTPWVIQRYRDTATAQGYTGDSVINSIGDIFAMSIGFLIADLTPWYIPVLLTIGEEIILGSVIRDNLTISIFQLLFASKTVSGWQDKFWKRKGEGKGNSSHKTSVNK